jgi:hypothetical protein
MRSPLKYGYQFSANRCLTNVQKYLYSVDLIELEYKAVLWIQIHYILARPDPEVIVPDPDLTFVTRNLYNFCKFFFEMVQFVFDINTYLLSKS